MALKLITGIDLANQKAINLADGTSATDAVTLQQLQAYVRGLNWKAAARAASTTNGALASAYASGQSLDGVTLATGDRILLKNQTTGSENGIYVVAASGAPTRAADATSSAQLDGAAIYVTSGTVNADKAYTQTVDTPTVGTTALVFSQFGGSNTYTAGNGLQINSNAFSILLDTNSGLVVSGTGLKVDTTVVTRKYAANCVATTNPQTFNHALGTTDIEVEIWEVSSGKKVLTDVTKTDANNISVDFGGTPSAAQWRVVVIG